MEQLIKLFIQLFDIGYQAGIAVLFVLAARAFLGAIRAPKKYSCMLWFLPFVRLAFPIQPESVFSLLPKQNGPGTALAEMVNEPVRYVYSENVIRSQAPVMPAVDVPKAADPRFSSLLAVLAFVWLAGIIILGILGLFSMWRLKRQLRMSVRLKENIYLTDGLPSAFVMGIFQPKIYLPSDIGEEAKRYVIAHEKAHIKRRDNISKLAVYCLLCIYWMNPVLWIGYYFFRKDVELACDEAVIGRQDEEYRKSYAEALLELSVSERGFKGMPLAFAEESPKERIVKVMEYQKPKLAAVVIGILLLAVLAVGLLTNPVTEEKTAEAPAAKDSGEPSENAMKIVTPEIDLSAEVEEAFLYYADEKQLIFGANSKLFVYSKEEEKVIRGVDLEALGEDGDCTVSAVSEDGSTVYLYFMNRIEVYGYHVADNLLTKEEKGLEGVPSVYTGINQNGNAVYETEDGKREDVIRNTAGTLGGLFYMDAAGMAQKLLVPKLYEDAVYFDVKDIHDLVKAEFTFNEEIYVIEDAEDLRWLEQHFGTAEKVKGESDCGFYEKLYLTRADGTVGIVYPATDSCWTLKTINGCYNYTLKENESFWKLFEDQQALTVPEVSAAGVHRAGFQLSKLHYYAPRNYSAYAYEIKDMSEEARLEERAQDALQELYDLTGYQIEECYYYYIESSESFCFGMTPDDLERDRTFYSRYYGEIESIYLTSSRRVWYSPVDMMIYPEGYDGMTEEEKAVWFVTHSGMYHGQQVADAYQPYEWDFNIWHVVMTDDTTYEITLDSEADIVGSIYGPYPTSNIQH